MIVRIKKDFNGTDFDTDSIVREIYPKGDYLILNTKSKTFKRAFENVLVTMVNILIQTKDE